MSQNPGHAAGSTSTEPQAETTTKPGQTSDQDQPQPTSQGVYNPSVPSTTMSPGGTVQQSSTMGGGNRNPSPGPMVGQPPAMILPGGSGTAGYGGQGQEKVAYISPVYAIKRSQFFKLPNEIIGQIIEFADLYSKINIRLVCKVLKAFMWKFLKMVPILSDNSYDLINLVTVNFDSLVVKNLINTELATMKVPICLIGVNSITFGAHVSIKNIQYILHESEVETLKFDEHSLIRRNSSLPFGRINLETVSNLTIVVSEINGFYYGAIIDMFSSIPNLIFLQLIVGRFELNPTVCGIITVERYKMMVGNFCIFISNLQKLQKLDIYELTPIDVVNEQGIEEPLGLELYLPESAQTKMGSLRITELKYYHETLYTNISPVLRYMPVASLEKLYYGSSQVGGFNDLMEKLETCKQLKITNLELETDHSLSDQLMGRINNVIAKLKLTVLKVPFKIEKIHIPITTTKFYGNFATISVENLESLLENLEFLSKIGLKCSHIECDILSTYRDKIELMLKKKSIDLIKLVLNTERQEFMKKSLTQFCRKNKGLKIMDHLKIKKNWPFDAKNINF